ncbi:unnamed protein product [Sphenostylis stenocarpa]|uniref:Uncharacterized protein n=1 Tax=Sphenostylis stenocarpa TaxID=92480 RepID=A0AA86S9V5_9FABA|nr:unnamed protein product [Sphenostylis stenocarpa]
MNMWGGEGRRRIHCVAYNKFLEYIRIGVGDLAVQFLTRLYGDQREWIWRPKYKKVGRSEILHFGVIFGLEWNHWQLFSSMNVELEGCQLTQLASYTSLVFSEIGIYTAMNKYKNPLG